MEAKPEETKVDLSGDIDLGTSKAEAPPVTSSSASKGASLLAMALAGVSAKDWLLGRREAIRPWKDFTNTNRFSKPTSLAGVGMRSVKNLQHFHGNYMVVFAILAIFCILTSPLLLVVLLAVAGACFFVNSKNKDNPFKFMGKEVPLTQQYAAVGLCSVPLFWVAGAGSAVFWMLGASVFFIMLHAVFYHQPDAVEEAFDIEMNPV